jgi:SAM-dependent methyltransferase
MSIATRVSASDAAPVGQPHPVARVLHLGRGAASPDTLPEAFFPRGAWARVRLDSDPAAAPDGVAAITGMAAVAEGSLDAVWSAHDLAHLSPQEVPLAMAEFLRVLKPGGFALVTMPDLRGGFGPSPEQGDAPSGHRTGFTAITLARRLQRSGFVDVRVRRDGGCALWATGVKPA